MEILILLCIMLVSFILISYLLLLEAQYAVRKLVIDVAKRHFKELEKLNLNAVLAHTA